VKGSAADLTTSQVSAAEYPVSFEDLFFEHYAGILRLLLRLLGNRAQAEEVANDVFLRLSRQPQSWLARNNVGAWLYRVATNAAMDSFRAADRRQRHESSVRPDEAPSTGPLTDLLKEEERRFVRRVLSKMKPAWAELLVLRSSGHSYEELAKLLDLKPGSVGTLLNRAEADFKSRYLSLKKREEKTWNGM
jgi:RNA polymerase sigma-70 factor (ECF subfamily)